ncbi:hypothetical protein Rleg10DRAFT_7163 [Rhizobium leguminosarum bv. trifolii WSM2012]|nr:hypothetical protein Rleg10DRAFT_7163 [Rhizobium leguminosarum bv. trifolii WSM2012]
MTAKKPTPPQALIRDLRQQLASAISDHKSYDVPQICVRIGLADGTKEEAFASKYKYASARITGEPIEKILEAARAYLLEEESFALAEAVHKLEEIEAPSVSEITRRRLASVFEHRPLCTEIDVLTLIRRVWPIDKMPSHDYPSSDRMLERDIWQHTVNNDDWDNRYLLERLGFFDCSQAQLFKFLAAVTEPLAQTAANQQTIVDEINAHLGHDGYKLVKVREMSGSPFYEVKPMPKGSPADAAISKALKAFDPNDVHARWTAALERRENDAPGAITLARTLLEDVCKWILAEAGQEWAEADDLPVLYRKLAKVLKLAPDDVTEPVFKQILGSCQSIVESLGALRNKLGDAHSIGPRRVRPAPRHAELAVNLSGSMATFLISTWQTRQAESARAAAAAPSV